eukprot:Nitzschia sp. Nitz4//scaffold143_size57137//42428//43531//NITZ4_006519-RA/size57137-processed-gene-0.52-mRNA-1//-1//CDS//3329536461//5084//frame0
MVMDYLCCEPVDRDSIDSDGSETASTDEGILECDYDTQVTKLYHYVEERRWEDVLYFLETGNWSNNSLFNAFAETEEPPSVQARTWVTALDERGNVRWCQLPLHAAVTFLAPLSVIQKLVEVYPKSVRCADDQDMLPLHYAFRFGAQDDVLLALLEKFPQAIGKKAVKERLPLDLAQYGPRPELSGIIDYYMQSAIRNAKKEWDAEYEKMVVGMRSAADNKLLSEVNAKNAQLVSALAELNQAKTELAAAASRTDRDGASLRSSKSGKVKRTRSKSATRNRDVVGSQDGGDLDAKSEKNGSQVGSEMDNSDLVSAPKQSGGKRKEKSTKAMPQQQERSRKLEEDPAVTRTRSGSTRRAIRSLFGRKK